MQALNRRRYLRVVFRRPSPLKLAQPTSQPYSQLTSQTAPDSNRRQMPFLDHYQIVKEQFRVLADSVTQDNKDPRFH